jgi:hypothetical protein
MQLLLGVFYIASDIYITNPLPVELQEYKNRLDAQPFGIFQFILMPFVFIGLVSNIGLLFFAKWSRHLFAITNLICCISMFIWGPSIQSGIETSLSEVEIFLVGFIVACIYLTDIKKYCLKLV